jgi:hypothetical protein
MSNESTAIMSVEDLVKQQLAIQQQKMAQMSVGANLISFKGGQLIVDGLPVPGGEAEVIVLANQGERSYYEGQFDPSKPQVPTCYSFDGDAPHPEARDPQHETCEGCPQNAWGSKGKGKACREGTRVALLPAAAPLDSAPMYQASFPITSMGSVKDFFSRCANSGKLSGQFITQLKVVPDAKSFFKASLTPKSQIEGQDLAVLLGRMETARKQLVQPYPVFEEAEEDVKPAGKKKF